MPRKLDVNPTFFVIPCNFGGDYGFTVLQLLSLTNCFSIQIPIIHDNISTQVADKRRYGFGQWLNSSIIHDSICSLIHKKRHPKHYHGDIKYHMTLNIIFTVVIWFAFLNCSSNLKPMIIAKGITMAHAHCSMQHYIMYNLDKSGLMGCHDR